MKYADSYEDLFNFWYHNVFRRSGFYLTMSEVSEESPWHRESTVAIHNDMVMTQYYRFAPGHWSHDDMLGAFAAAFHDVGKPKACAINGIKYKPERGHYKSFGGHELISSRMWEDWAVGNFDYLVDTFNFTIEDVYRVGWMIEKHLPWGLKKADKLDHLYRTVGTLFQPSKSRAFSNLLLADTYGRMSDDYVEKRQKAATFVDNMEGMIYEYHAKGYCEAEFSDVQRTLYLPIGPSGVGKSTYRREALPNAEVFSWDELRLKYYVKENEQVLGIKLQYRLAFERSTADNFTGRANVEFTQLLKNSKEDIYVDNTNLTKKRRRFFIDQARKHGYQVCALLFPCQLNTVVDRQASRNDKAVPIEAVTRHYETLQLPEYGEVDFVKVLDSNCN